MFDNRTVENLLEEFAPENIPSDDLQTILNDQMNKELYSAYLYYGMSAYFRIKQLPGLGKWFKDAGIEEMTHAEKIHSYLQDANAKITMPDIKSVSTSYDSPIEAAKAAYQHEVENTKSLESIYQKAKEQKDSRLEVFMHWFVNEQREEEAKTFSLVKKLEMIGKNATGLMDLDHEIGEGEILNQKSLLKAKKYR